VAAPVRASDGSVLATICASGPSYRLRVEDIEAVGLRTRATANEVSRRLGFAGVAAAGDRPR